MSVCGFIRIPVISHIQHVVFETAQVVLDSCRKLRFIVAFISMGSPGEKTYDLVKPSLPLAHWPSEKDQLRPG